CFVLSQPLEQEAQVEGPVTKSAGNTVDNTWYASVPDRRFIPFIDISIIVQIAVNEIAHPRSTEIVNQAAGRKLFFRIKKPVSIAIIDKVPELLSVRVSLFPFLECIVLGAQCLTPVNYGVFRISEHPAGMNAQVFIKGF